MHPCRVIGYVGGRADFERISAAKLSHVNYAFGQVGADGHAALRNPHSRDHLAALVRLKSKNPGLKVNLSIGGWGADNFSDAAFSHDSRMLFAQSLVPLIEEHSLDGIDLDWEYPGQPGPGIKYRPEDKKNFTLWLAAIRDRLDKLSDSHGRAGAERFTVTIASADGEYFEHTQMDKAHSYLDWVNIMAYDFYGSLTPTTGHHTGLFRSDKAQEPVRCTASSVEQHVDAGIPPEKLVVGAAFYGRGWTGVNPHRGGLFQPYAHYGRDYGYGTIVRELVGKQGYERHWDESAQAPYLWNAETATLISYDDPQSIAAKTRFVIDHGLGGMMYWEHSQDPEEVLLDAIAAGLDRAVA